MRRKRGLRKRLFGTPERPRLTVYRSETSIYAQIIDDETGRTLCQASSRSKDLKGNIPAGCNIASAKAVGSALAERAKAQGIAKVCFDRNGFRYHGRIKSLADAVREGGIAF